MTGTPWPSGESEEDIMWRLSPPVPTKSRTTRRCRHIITPDTYMRIVMQRLLNLQGKTVHSTAHVGRTRRQPDANTRRRDNHRRSTLITRRNVTKPTSCPTLSDVPSGSVISILPSGTCSGPLVDDGSRCPAPLPFATSPIVCTWQEYRRRFRPENAAPYLATPVP